MKTTVVVRLPPMIRDRIAHAAAENEVNAARMASLAVKAAAQLYLSDDQTSAVPHGPLRKACPADITFSISGDTMQIVAEAASRHCLTIEQQLVSILAASVKGYPVRSSGPVATPDRPARRDAAYYAKHSVAFR